MDTVYLNDQAAYFQRYKIGGQKTRYSDHFWGGIIFVAAKWNLPNRLYINSIAFISAENGRFTPEEPLELDSLQVYILGDTYSL